MTDSILTSTKKMLGLDESYTAFDLDITMHINSVFSTLRQLGVGPTAGFMITDASSTWTEFLGGDSRYNSVKSYVYMKVRMMFDSPSTAHLVTALEKQITEMEWRINSERESTDWTSPVFVDAITADTEFMFDGGSA